MTVTCWLDDAGCRGLPVHVFFPARGESAARALRVCAGCAVRAACLADALAAPELVGQHGVAGGLTARERTELLRARNAAA